MKSTLLLVFFLVLVACQNEKPTNDAKSLILTEIKTPSISGGEGNLFVSETGQLYLSWVEFLDDTTDVLTYALLENDVWSTPKVIAQGTDWFVNWADFPSFVAYKDGGKTLAAHWLQKRAEGTYDYDVHISQSTDGGQNWNKSFIPHKDEVAAEHGFVTMMPLSEDRIFATWLDGRNTKKENGAMTIRVAEIDKTGQLYEEVELDARTCDCCQTDAAMTKNGPIVAYRDRSDEEIRDIFYTRKVNGEWTAPKAVFADNWKISGCPVNGPAVAANGDNVAIAWFAAPKDTGEVKLVLSTDAGATFGKPISIDDGNPLGRVDVLLLEQGDILVSWLEKTEKSAEIRLVKISPDGTKEKSKMLIQSTASRESGFPILAKANDKVYMSWTEVDSVGTRVKTLSVAGMK